MFRCNMDHKEVLAEEADSPDNMANFPVTVTFDANESIRSRTVYAKDENSPHIIILALPSGVSEVAMIRS